jgi:xanthine dehydrogenase YagT iron-sulfur-binding subunit
MLRISAVSSSVTPEMRVHKRRIAKKRARRPATAEAAASFGPGPVIVQLNVNGQVQSVSCEPCLTLLQVLRERLGLTGAKQVCDRATCGACTVLVDRKRVYACSILAIDAQDGKIETVESLAQGSTLTPLQQAFVAADASQCGYCTPGFIMSATAFLADTPSPTRDDIGRGLCGNICRCGTYAGIEEALLSMAKTVKPSAWSSKRRKRG